MAQRPDIFTLNASHTLANGLVFAGLGAHAGSTRYHDSSAYGNTGTLTNMEPATDWVWDRTLNRMVIDCDGTNDYVETSHIAGTVSNVTVCAWVYFNRDTNLETIIGARSGGINLRLRGDLAGDPLQMSFNGVSDASSDSNPVSVGKWTHIAAKNDGVKTYFMINGMAFSNLNQSAFTATTYKTFVGSLNDSGSRTASLSGRISDPLIFARFVSDPEIMMISDPSNVMLSGLILPPRRKWWPVVSGAAPTFKAAWATKRRQTIGGGVI